jgi:hypothetical protein
MSKKSVISQEVKAMPVKKTTTIDKLDFDGVNAVNHSLFFAFHQDEDLGEDDELNPKFFTVWHAFLAIAGWTEDEYFAELENQEHICKDCGQPINDDDDLDLDIDITDTGSTDAANKPN